MISLDFIEAKMTKLQEGDILILRYPGTLNTDQVDCMASSLNKGLRLAGMEGKVSILVLEQGMDLEVYRGCDGSDNGSVC